MLTALIAAVVPATIAAMASVWAVRQNTVNKGVVQEIHVLTNGNLSRALQQIEEQATKIADLEHALAISRTQNALPGPD